MFFEIQKNLLSIIVLLILFISLMRQLNWKEYINQIFFYLIWFNIIFLALDSIITMTNGNTSMISQVGLYISVGFYFALTPILGLLWLFYTDITIFQSKERLLKLSYLPVAIFVVNLGLVITSYFTNIIFEITSENLLIRSTYFFLPFVLNSIVFMYTIFHVYANKDKIRKKEFIPLLAFGFPPFISGVVYLFFKDINFIWNSFVVSQLLIYIYIQSKITSTDFLTGLLNKREYEFIVKQLSSNKPKNLEILGIMIDINNFKRINDVYGHRVGDEALISTSDLLKSAVRKQDYVFRVGGDEFVVILLSDEKNKVDQVIQRIHQILDQFNQTDTYEFDLSFSIGKGTYDDQKHKDLNHFFDHLDEMMYAQKKAFNQINEDGR